MATGLAICFAEAAPNRRRPYLIAIGIIAFCGWLEANRAPLVSGPDSPGGVKRDWPWVRKVFERAKSRQRSSTAGSLTHVECRVRSGQCPDEPGLVRVASD